MMDLEGVVLGTLLSIPVGIGTGLLVDPLRSWIDKKALNRSVEVRDEQEEYKIILLERKFPHVFTQDLVRAVLKATLILGVSLLIIFILDGIGEMFHSNPAESNWSGDVGLNLINEVVAVVGILLIIGACRPILARWHRVRNFEEYSRRTDPSVRAAAEAEVRAIEAITSFPAR
jgi:hypothetical protein